MEVLQIIGWVLALLITLWSLYWYLTATFDYWEKKGVKFIPPKLIVGSVTALFGKNSHLIEVERVAKYGRLYGYFEGRRPALTVSDPDIIRNILVKDFPSFMARRTVDMGDSVAESMLSIATGEKWKRIRSIVSPTFSTGKIKRVTSIFMDSADTVCKSFEKCASQNEDMDAKRLFGAYTMDVIASAAFGTKIDSHNDPDNKFVAEARKIFGQLPFRFIFFFFFPQIFKILRLSPFAQSTFAFFKDVTLKIIEERKKTGEVRNDFLQLLLDARDVPESNKDIQEESEKKSDLKRLSHDELLAQCLLFFIAGYDTTASTLSFATYLLALNPECQEKLIKEVDTMLAENGEMTYEGIQSMKYLDNVVSETLRFYPPGIRVERTADEDYELGDTGITVPKGMVVGIPVYAMHHDPEFYPDPEKFDPDRFTVEGKASRNQYAYLPFGAGPRNCVGMRFALVEVKVCLAKVFSRFRLKKSPNIKDPLEFSFKAGLLQPIGILLTVEKRTDVP